MSLSALARSTSCNETKYRVGVVPNTELCTGVDITTEYDHCYPVLPTGCDSSNVLNLGDGCYEVVENHCTGYGCAALCDVVCDYYTCGEVVSYRGPSCAYFPPNDCTPDSNVEECVEYKTIEILPIPSGCNDYCTGCTAYGCEWCMPGWWNKETNCWDGYYVSNLPDAVLCANEDAQGERAQIAEADGDILYCDSVGSQNYGDPWCPVNYVYEEGFCQQQTAVCDQGFTNNLMYGCDNLYTPDNDLLFSEYQIDCVRQEFVVGEDYYDSTCCYDSVFNGYELYQWGIEETHIKIY